MKKRYTAFANNRHVFASSTSKRIPYDLVSMLAVIRDWATVGDDAYVNREHKLLVDIADSLYNVGKSVANSFSGEYLKLYNKYGVNYFDKVINDISAIDSQVSSHNINDLITEYEEMAEQF